MARAIERVQGVCGGAPTLQGTRLTCADVVRTLPALGRVRYLEAYSHLTFEDVRQALAYCAEQRCLVDTSVTYCDGCSLDLRPPPEPADVLIPTLEDLRKNPDLLSRGQAFLGTPEEEAASRRPRDLWKEAAQVLRSLPPGS